MNCITFTRKTLKFKQSIQFMRKLACRFFVLKRIESYDIQLNITFSISAYTMRMTTSYLQIVHHWLTHILAVVDAILLSALEVCSRQGAIQIHVYLTFTFSGKVDQISSGSNLTSAAACDKTPSVSPKRDRFTLVD